MRLGWCIESVLHNGRASGSAVAGALLPSGLPFGYRAKNLPQLWKTTEPDTVKEQRCEDRDRFESFFSDKSRTAYSFHLLPRKRQSDLNEKALAAFESRIANQIFKNHSIFVIHSDLAKETAKAAEYEHGLSRKIFALRKYDYENDYFLLRRLCGMIHAVVNRIVSQPDRRENEAGPDWWRLCHLMTRLHGFLSLMGFNFPDGDKILSLLIARIQPEPWQEWAKLQGNKIAGGKLSGGGLGGSLVLVAGADRRDILDSVEGWVDEIAQESGKTAPSKIALLYSSHDRERKVESRGLVRHYPGIKLGL